MISDDGLNVIGETISVKVRIISPLFTSNVNSYNSPIVSSNMMEVAFSGLLNGLGTW